MYQIENSGHVLEGGKKLLRGRVTRPNVSRTVFFLGLTSLLTDISSEMVSTILPLYIFVGLGLTPLQYGLVDGLYQGSAALVRVASGVVSDRWRRHKDVAAAGYGISAVCRLALLAAGSSYGAITAVVMADRTGKGIRTAPRDALISLSTPKERLGTAFGVHRSMDTAGAMLGPLVAFGLLYATRNAYDAVFVVSFCFALLGLGTLLLFVENRTTATQAEAIDRKVSLRAGFSLLTEPRFRTLVLVGGVLGLATISDGLLYLGLQRRLDIPLGAFPLLYVATAFVYMLLSIPVGRLADRVGRGRVFIAGYVLLLVVYSSLLLPDWGMAQLGVYLLLFGAYYAMTEGVLMAMASAVIPEELRGSGLAILATAVNVARLLSSVLFGALWTWRGVETATVAFGAALVVAMALGALALVRSREPAPVG